MTLPIPTNFVQQNANLTWLDWSWGFGHGYVDRSDLVGMASSFVFHNSTKDTLIQLACVSDEESDYIQNLLDKMAREYQEPQSAIPKEKWLYLTLAWLFHNRSNYQDPLGEVESIYADFDYPEQIEHFVRYMPPKDWLNPSAYTLEQNLARIMKRWEDYLLEKRVLFAPQS